MSTKNKIAFVTGANRGIGKEVVRQLIDHDFFVIMTGRDNEKLISAQKEIDPGKSRTSAIQLDVSSKEGINNVGTKILETTDRIDVLVNNAAIIGSTNGIVKTSPDEFENVIQTNSFGPFFLMRSLHPFLKKSKDARVINVSSGMGSLEDLDGNYAAYRLSKVFLNMITLLASREFSRDGIKVNTMCPGWVKTDMGGKSANRTVEKGAETVIWLATEKNISTGKFYRDKREIPF